MQLDQRISELLYHYDCVIVPELGGFVTEYRSARIDKLLHVIHPPSKDLRFNAQLQKNDGLLADSIARAENISHEEANKQIKDAVEGYFTLLEKGRPVAFDKVGILYLDSHKNIQFSPDKSVNYLIDSYRLKKVYARPVEKEITAVPQPVENVKKTKSIIAVEEIRTEHEKESEVELKPVIELPATNLESSSNRSRKKWLAAAALVPLTLFSGILFMRSDAMNDGQLQLSELNPFHQEKTQVYSPINRGDLHIEFAELPKQKTLDSSAIKKREALGRVEVEEDPDLIPEEKIIAEAVNTYVAPKAVSLMEFHVIGGCFSELENAESMVDGLRAKGYDAFIIDQHKGLFRVAYGSYSERSSALELLTKVKEEEQIAAWLLRKK